MRPLRIAALALAAALAAAPPAAAQREDGTGAHPIIVVSREAILRDTAAGRAIREAERDLGADFQARVDAAMAEIDAEEEDLARRRSEIDREEFETLARRFDRKVRTARRRSQQQAAELQSAFRAAREELSSKLAAILIDVLREQGASIVLDADQVMIAAPSVNMTKRVIELFDERVPPPQIAVPEELPLLPSAEELAEETEEGGGMAPAD